MSFVLHGIGVSGGIAIGRAQLISHATLEVAHYSIAPEQAHAEIDRLTQALQAVQKELEGLHSTMTAGDAPAEFGAFLDVHWMILTDPTLHEVPKRTIAEQLCNAEWPLTQQLGVLVERSLNQPITLVSGVSSCLLTLFQRLLSLSGKATVSEVWPHLEVVVHGARSLSRRRHPVQEPALRSLSH